MDKIDILTKSITLVFKECEINNEISSIDLINNIIKEINNDKIQREYNGGTTDVVNSLIEILEILLKNNDCNLDRISFEQTINNKLKGNLDIVSSIMSVVNQEMDSRLGKLYITNVKKQLHTYFKEKEFLKIIRSAFYTLNSKRLPPNEMEQYKNKLLLDLDALNITSNKKDPALVKEIDFNNKSELKEEVKSVKDDLQNNSKLISGWSAMNKMIYGGFRRGEFVTVGALQHNYKSGLVNSLFCQLCMFNKPLMDDPDKKPLMVLFSLEDDLKTRLSFIYEYLYYDEFLRVPDMDEINEDEITEFIVNKLTRNGYNIKIYRIDPTKWSFNAFFNKIYELEAEGYELHGIVMDYLMLMPTTGALNTGGIGSDLRDVFRRIRNFCNTKKILYITPHQLSTDAKQLLRDGVSSADFVKEIANKGYYSGSKQLDQEIDLEVYAHIAKVNRKSILTLQRGKHRGVNNNDEENFYFGLKFPRKAPIPSDVNREDEVNIIWKPDNIETDIL